MFVAGVAQRHSVTRPAKGGSTRRKRNSGNAPGLILVDREVDVAHAIFTSSLAKDFLLTLESDAADFSTWQDESQARPLLYVEENDPYGKPAYDRNLWRDEGEAHFLVAPWLSGGGPFDIVVYAITELEWTPN